MDFSTVAELGFHTKKTKNVFENSRRFNIEINRILFKILFISMTLPGSP